MRIRDTSRGLGCDHCGDLGCTSIHGRLDAARSVPGEGSTFRIELAIAKPAGAQDEPLKIASPFAETAKSRTILCIEDTNLQLIEWILAHRPSIGLRTDPPAGPPGP